MAINSFTIRDWALFLGSYVLWLPLAALIWRLSRKRFGKATIRAIFFGALFAPGLVPIVREAYVIAPAILGLLYYAVFISLGFKGNSDILVLGLQWILVPIFALACAYGIRERSRNRNRI